MSNANHDGSNEPEMEEKVVSLYVSRKKLYPRAVTGIFAYWRWALVVITQLVFFGVPWLTWGGRQAVLFDIGARKFYLFSLVLSPQDLVYLTALLVISALALFLFTAVAGRLWCGYSCPQTVYTQIFMWIEHFIEGDRAKRMRLDKNGSFLEKLIKKGSKHLIWILFSLWTGFTFVGFFVPIHSLWTQTISFNIAGWTLFGMLFYGAFTYMFAGMMREQVCKYMCPYARFQSAMFDKDTLIVTYDAERGEPRGPRSTKANLETLNLGSCIDCNLCVQVCPTGIDIRDGLQYECINCAACIDVCDSIMEKMNYPKGLIRMTTENGMRNKWTRKQIIARILRPRILIYTSILSLIIISFWGSLLFLRTPLRVDIIKDRSVIDRIAEGGRLENVYQVQLINSSESTQKLTISVEGIPDISLATDGQVVLAPTESERIVSKVQIPFGSVDPGSHEIYFIIKSEDGSIQLKEKATFFVR